MISVSRLQLLREVAARGTIAAAAEAVAYTPSAVSQQLSKLESEVGAPLLERHGRGVVLTELGRVAVHHAEAVFQTLDRTEAAIEAAMGRVSGRIGIAAFASAATEIVAPAVSKLGTSAPELRVEVVQLEDQRSITELRLGTVDIALLQDYTHMPHARPQGISHHAMLDDPLMLAVPQDWEYRSIDSLAAYADVPWISEPAESPAGQALDYAARRAEFVPDVRYRVEGFQVTAALVARGLGVALLSQLGGIGHASGVRLVDLPLGGMVRHIYAGTRHEEVQRPNVRATMEALTEAAVAIPTCGPI